MFRYKCAILRENKNWLSVSCYLQGSSVCSSCAFDIINKATTDWESLKITAYHWQSVVNFDVTKCLVCEVYDHFEWWFEKWFSRHVWRYCLSTCLEGLRKVVTTWFSSVDLCTGVQIQYIFAVLLMLTTRLCFVMKRVNMLCCGSLKVK